MIKAIETRYKGYRFRSRLEARWAVFFDTMGSTWTWEYEPEGFDLNGLWYLPDFWFPKLRAWGEVKGREELDEAFWKSEEGEKISSLAFYSQRPVMVFCSLGAPITYVKPSDKLDDVPPGAVVVQILTIEPEAPGAISVHAHALATARAARFEHGERP